MFRMTYKCKCIDGKKYSAVDSAFDCAYKEVKKSKSNPLQRRLVRKSMSTTFNARLHATLLLTPILLFANLLFVSAQPREAISNKDVVEMTKMGLSPEVIIAKIKSSKQAFDTSPAAMQQLKADGVADSVVISMMQSGLPEEKKPVRLKDELASSFNRLKTSVVTIWTENGHGTGFIFDARGLIMTNQHVVGPSEYIAVQFDSKVKIPAVQLVASPEKDIAILWIDIQALPEATVAPIAKASPEEPTLVEGERVFTIGSPLNQKKIITTGVASKIEERAIISDININHGNSGGALFNSLGEVVGITTFGDPDSTGPGVSGIVRIEEATDLIVQARAKILGKKPSAGRLLPVEPSDTFPLDAIRSVATVKKFDTKPYIVNVGDFDVVLITPPLTYRIETEAEREAARTREKRNKKEGSIQGTYRPFDRFRGWGEYVGEYRPVLIIQATPELGESFWGAVGRGVAANYGIHTQARLRFKTDFYKMRLICGEKEVEPIHPAKIAHLLSTSNYFVSIKDATFEGLYTYPADAITPACGKVSLEIYSEKEPNKPKIKELSEETIRTVITDFIPYFEKKSVSMPTDKGASDFFKLGSQHLNQKNLEMAKVAFDSAIEADPKHVAAYTGRAVVHFLKGDTSSAMGDFNKALELDPSSSETLYNRGFAYFEQKEFDLAIADYTAAIRFEPRYALPHFNLGNLYLSQGKFDLAAAHYSKVIELLPNSGEAYAARSKAYCLSGQKQAAVADEKKAQERGAKRVETCP